MTPKSYHDTRFTYDERRETLWKSLCEGYFDGLVAPHSHVLELGAGYGHFINNIRAERRSAVDQWPGLLDHLQPSVRGHIGSVTDLSAIPDHSVDFVFASNLFEHLTQAQFTTSLAEIKKKLATGGSLNILQPNYKRCYRDYFDDYTHIAIYSDVSLSDFLAANGFVVLEIVRGFLPLSIKSTAAPVSPWLIKLYLHSPWKPFAKQMFLRAKAGNEH